jgi:hypothetical protein
LSPPARTAGKKKTATLRRSHTQRKEKKKEKSDHAKSKNPRLGFELTTFCL